MSNNSASWVREMCGYFAEVEAETGRVLGKEKANYFVEVDNDRMSILQAINVAYPGEQGIVLYSAVGLAKEVAWLRFFFVAGNYPLVLARLRHIWEFVFRAYFADTYVQTGHRSFPTPGPSLDDKLGWLEAHGSDLNWPRCIEPVLRAVHPPADREAEVRERYHGLWRHLHQHVHPSAHLTGRLAESGLVLTDGFDEEWAKETLAVAADVFDLVWLAILHRYPKAGDRLGKLWGDYPTLSLVFKQAPPSA
jgi:hypothetical protein